MSGTYEDLRAWQVAMEVALEIYRATPSFPKEENYGLKSQLRRAAVSVASNIAEGKGHSSDKQLLHFLSCARGSLYEVQTQLLIAKQLNYLESEASERLVLKAAELGRLLNGLIRAFQKAAAA